MKTYVVIPARYQSSRLPGKLLLPINEKPIIRWVYDLAKKAEVDDVIVATDDERIAECIKKVNGNVCMTDAAHHSGTERIGEVIQKMSFLNDDIIINLQGDEPFLPPSLIDQLVVAMRSEPLHVATLCEPLNRVEMLFNPNVTKVLLNIKGDAIYFSRAPIPWYRDGFQNEPKMMPLVYQYYRHIGIYAYRVDFIKRYIQEEASLIENVESLEQLRILWLGEKIRVLKALASTGIGIDTLDDLKRAQEIALASLPANF